MNTDTLLKALAGTLEPLKDVRRELEQQLRLFESQQGLTEYLLDVVVDQNIPLGVQVAAAIFLKNRVANHWLIPENKPPLQLAISMAEKPAVKRKLLEAIGATHSSAQLQQQLTRAMLCILAAEKWEEIVPAVASLLSNPEDTKNVCTGLICLYEYTKNYRWLGISSKLGSNPVMEDITEELFPALENFVRYSLAQPATDSRDILLRYAIKIFKFATVLGLPTYLTNMEKMGAWCEFHLILIKEQGRDVTSDYDDWGGEDVRGPRARLVKWCYGNLNRLLMRHGGGIATSNRSESTFAQQFLTGFVPQILTTFYEVIEQLLAKSRWLLPPCVYHIISFFEHLIETPAWPLVGDHLEAVMRHLVLPILSADYRKIALYEEAPEEYISRYFDSADRLGERLEDLAASNFVFRLGNRKFKLTCELMLTLMKEKFMERAADRSSTNGAGGAEGALRLFALYAPRLNLPLLPVQGQVDTIVHTFVCPELTAETCAQFPWLTGRALDTVARMGCKFADSGVLEQVFQLVAQCFQMNDHFAVRLMAADALCTLATEDAVAEIVAAQLPQLMGALMEMSKEHELDILTSVMEIFVERFAKNLEPYATEMLAKLVEKFIKVASQMLGENGADTDKEYQAAGILSTLTTLVVAMTSAPEVARSMEPGLRELVTFVLDNAMLLFLSETMEILDAVLASTRTASPFIWDMFNACILSFDTYAYEYFDTFQMFFESVIVHGFVMPDMSSDSKPVQDMIQVCFTILKSDTLDPMFADLALQLLEMTVIALKERMGGLLSPFLQEIYGIFRSLDEQDAFDGYMLHHLLILKIIFGALYVDAETTMAFLRDQGFLTSFYQLWLKHCDDFQSVYGCKLQALACAAIILLNAITMVPQDLVGETADLLLANVLALPNAIRMRDEILNRELVAKPSILQNSNDTGEDDQDDDNDGEYDYDDAYEDLEVDEAELEALKETPIDNVNVFYMFAELMVTLQQLDAHKYQQLFGDMDDTQQELVNKLVQLMQQARA